MPISSDKRPPRRTKAQAAEHALAHRVAASLNPESLGVAEAPAVAVKPVKAVREGPARDRVALFEAGAQRINEAVASAQDMARETAQTIAESRLQTAQGFVAFQQRVLAMVHANLSEGFAAAQSLVRAPNVGEAIRVQNLYAQGAVKALSAQAAELRTLSADLVKEAREPLVAQWTKSMDQLRQGLGG